MPRSPCASQLPLILRTLALPLAAILQVFVSYDFGGSAPAQAQ
jgi:hypothetical protein